MQFITWESKIWSIEDGYRRLISNPDQGEITGAYGNVREQSSYGDASKYLEGMEITGWNAGMTQTQAYTKKIYLDTADIVEEYQTMQEEALADIGVYEWDTETATAEALEILGPYFEREFADLKKDIQERQLTSSEDYNLRLEQIKGDAFEEIQQLNITEAKTEADLLARLDALGGREAYEKAEQGRIMANAAEELQASLEDVRGRGEYLTDEQRRTIDETEEAHRIKVADIEGSTEYSIEEKNRLIAEAQEALEINIRDISGQEEFAVETEERLIAEVNEKLTRDVGDIGARKEYSYEKARQEWDTRLKKEEEVQLGRGRGFSGVMREEMGNLSTQQGADLGEIIRQFTTKEEETRAKAEYQVQGAEAGITEARRKGGLLTEKEVVAERQTREEAEAAQAEIERRAQTERETAQLARGSEVAGAEARIGETERQVGVAEEEAMRRESQLREEATAKTGEIGRLATAQGEEAQREAMFTQERTQAAREEVEAQKERGILGAETTQAQAVRAYGEGEDLGIYGGMRYGEIERTQKEAELAQVNEILEQRREEHGMAREVALGELPSYEAYYAGEKAKRTPSKYTL